MLDGLLMGTLQLWKNHHPVWAVWQVFEACGSNQGIKAWSFGDDGMLSHFKKVFEEQGSALTFWKGTPWTVEWVDSDWLSMRMQIFDVHVP